MQRVAVLLLSLCACSPAVTLDPLPEDTEENALFVSGAAPANAHVEIRGGASKVLTQANADGRFQTYVALEADRTNALSAHPEGQVAALSERNRRVVRHHSRDVTSFLAQSKAAPDLALSGDAHVNGLIATVRGQTAPRAAVRISGGARDFVSAANADGAFELNVVLKQQMDNTLTVVATSKAGIESAALTVHVAPIMSGAAPPIPALDPALPKTASHVGYTIRGSSAPGMGVQIESGGKVVATGFADANGAFALGVELTPNATSAFLVKSINHAGVTSSASAMKITWAGPAPASKYPIVLVHGMGGFDSILGYDYFYGIEDRLSALGFQVYVASLTPLAKPAQRAQELKQQIQALTSGKVNIIAHSQGTIDARYMISQLGMAGQVASYTSIAGPHLGSKVADVALQLIPGPVSKAIDFLLAQLGLDWGAVAALSETEMTKFNALTPDAPGVYYQSYAGIADPFGIKTGVAISAYLVAPWTVLDLVDGAASDGLVTVPSAKWGNFRGTISGDHITEVGQVFGLVFSFDYRQFYEDTALDLTSRGF